MANEAKPWTWEGSVCGARVRVNVGAHALYVERVGGGDVAEAMHRAALAEALGAAVAELRGTRPPGTTLDTISRMWWPPRPLTAEQEQALVAEGWRKGDDGAWHLGAREPSEVIGD